MSTNMQAIFAPLRKAIEGLPITAAYTLDMIGEYAHTRPVIAAAMSFHLAEIFKATPGMGWPQALAEAHWLVFFNRESAELFGTHEMLDQGDERMIEFVKYVCISFQMDKAQEGSGNYHAPATNQ